MTPPNYPALTFTQPMVMSSFHSEPTHAVCDTCRARKVRCDRNEPCGNCVDGNIQCTRTPSSIRRAQHSAKRQRSAESSPATNKSSRRHELEVSPAPTAHSAPSLAHSPSIMEAQDFIQWKLSSSRHLEADRLAVLNSAMSFVNRLSQSEKPVATLVSHRSRVVDILEGITYPSIELLCWMLREIPSGKIGPYVLDYFKHVSLKSLKSMGLALINRDADAETLLLSSICVNSIAFKFINTILSVDQPQGMEEGLRMSAGRHLESVKLGISRLPLLAAPSLLLLQSLLCSAFITQGTGDSTSCWTFISAACKICEDLGLESKVKESKNDLDEDREELYFCFAWCHTLDKNYSMMLGRGRCLLEHDGLDAVFSSEYSQSISHLLSTYLLFVPVQAIFIAELHPTKILNNRSLLARVELVVTDLLRRMDIIRGRIVELRESHGSWDGLYMGSELNAIDFSFHSLRTSILRSRQICSPGKPTVDNDCLDSARMAMSTLRAIQVEASTSISDIRAYVSFMHWTVLYHPLTPFFVLFCHVVATSNAHDFHTLQLVSSGLDKLTPLSVSIAKLQKIFGAFVELCAGLMIEPAQLTTDDLHLTLTDRSTRPAPPNQNVISSAPETSLFPDQMENNTSHPEMAIQASTEGISDPIWGLFDAQPTLDWLDADFSFLDESQ